MYHTVLLKARVTYRTDSPILAPLPVDESDVESPTEDIPATKVDLAEPTEEFAVTDATMKDKDDDEEDEEDDDDDPETLVRPMLCCCILLTAAQLCCRSHQGSSIGLRGCR